MDAALIVSAGTFVLSSLAVFLSVVSVALASRWRRRALAAAGRAMAAEAALEAMTRAHDPGRDVHARLAAALEAGLVRDEGGPDPAGRRAAAMALAATILETVARANLQLEAGDPDP